MLPAIVMSLLVVQDEVRGLRILGVTFDSKFTIDTHLREVVSKTA